MVPQGTSSSKAPEAQLRNYTAPGLTGALEPLLTSLDGPRFRRVRELLPRCWMGYLALPAWRPRRLRSATPRSSGRLSTMGGSTSIKPCRPGVFAWDCNRTMATMITTPVSEPSPAIGVSYLLPSCALRLASKASVICRDFSFRRFSISPMYSS